MLYYDKESQELLGTPGTGSNPSLSSAMTHYFSDYVGICRCDRVLRPDDANDISIPSAHGEWNKIRSTKLQELN